MAPSSKEGQKCHPCVRNTVLPMSQAGQRFTRRCPPKRGARRWTGSSNRELRWASPVFARACSPSASYGGQAPPSLTIHAKVSTFAHGSGEGVHRSAQREGGPQTLFVCKSQYDGTSDRRDSVALRDELASLRVRAQERTPAESILHRSDERPRIQARQSQRRKLHSHREWTSLGSRRRD